MPPLMPMMHPFTFTPILMERVWGGRELERLYRKNLPDGKKAGESWEISDRDEGFSVIANGFFAGKTLRWLMEHHGGDVLGRSQALNGRFPLLCKVLDAKEKLSLQVHPPAHLASGMGGEPKTEAWYVAHADAGAEIYVGLKRGVTKAEFESHVHDGRLAECFHRLSVKAGDVMFLPSGRVHALGAGIVIFEVQQNSDTTYRVFDWNRMGADGKPRQLHVEQALQCIDFDDFEPPLASQVPVQVGNGWERVPLVSCAEFEMELLRSPSAGGELRLDGGTCRVLAAVNGECEVRDGTTTVRLHPGQFCLLPAALQDVEIASSTGVTILVARPA